MEKFIRKLRTDYPDLTFIEGSFLCWSPERKEIYFDPQAGKNGLHGVLHEIGHARLQHTSYASDVDLLKKESDAWLEAINIAASYGISLDKIHIQDCIDTYRDWLHKRSTCPNCQSNGVQQNPLQYVCLNCQCLWKVTSSRFFRPYRLEAKK